MTIAIMLLTFVVLLLIGVPIGISLGAGVLAAIFLDPGVTVGVEVIAQRMYGGMESSALMAIPFFILAGNLMTQGGISRALVNFTNSIVGGVRGGMAYVLVLACAFFAMLSGSAPATVVAIGVMLYQDMVRLGYNRGRVAGLLVVSAGLGPVIPPSIIMVVVAALIGTSVGDMFASGFMVGGLIAAALVIVVTVLAIKEKWPRDEERFSFGRLAKSFVKALPALALPGIILGGIYSGLFTPTESAAIAVVWAAFASLVIYRQTKLSEIWGVLITSAKSTAMILFIVAASTAFSWLFAYSGTASDLVAWIISMDLSAWAFMAIIAVVLLFLGVFLEGTAVAILMVPILWPIADMLGVHAVHFGMVISLAAVVGTMTPPVAVSVVAAMSVTKLKMGEVAKGLVPFFVTFVAIVAAVVFIPWISTVLVT